MTTLNGALPETAAAFQALEQYAASRGITIAIADFGGVRTLADTTRILGYRQQDFNADVKAGRVAADTSLQKYRPISPFGSSYHNYGAAFDVAIVARPASMSEYQALATLAACAPTIGLRWGGNFVNADPPHFELAISLADAKARYQQASGNAVPPNSVLDNLTNSLKQFLPSLTPSADTVEGMDALDPTAYENADVSGLSTDDSGEAATVAQAQQNGPNVDGMVVLGVLVAGTLLWVLRRRYFGP